VRIVCIVRGPFWFAIGIARTLPSREVALPATVIHKGSFKFHKKEELGATVISVWAPNQPAFGRRADG
jgi:hypothetical protein